MRLAMSSPAWHGQHMPRITLTTTAILIILAGCSCAPVATPAAPQPAPRLIVWADSHGDEQTEWPTLIGCADEIVAHIGWAIADEGPISPPPLTEQIGTLATKLNRGDRVVIELGSNDVIDVKIPYAADVRGQIEDAVKASGASVIWATIPPSKFPYRAPLDQLGAARRTAWNRWVRTLTASRRVDVAKPLGDTLDASEDIGDGVHLSASAHRAMATAAAGLCP